MSKIVENIEEVVLAVRNQDEVISLFEDWFGLDFNDGWTVPADKMVVKSARVGETQFHIVASQTPDAVIGRFIAEKGEGLHHIAFRVKNLDETIARLRGKGVKLVPDTPRTGERSRFIFVHPKSAHGLLIELIERRSDNTEAPGRSRS